MIDVRKLKVIIFEDDKTTTHLLSTILKVLGCEVSAFPDPTAYSHLCPPDSKCPKEVPCADVIISDIMMPHVTGTEFLRLLQKRDCKILNSNRALMSAGATQLQQIEAKELGYHFISKPFRIDRLRQWIIDCTNRTGGTIDSE